MSRVQLSLNVNDLDAAVAFYTRLLGTEPAKLRPGYANFAVGDPPLKLVLNVPGNGPAGAINHLGVEVATPGDVTEAGARLAAALPVQARPGTVCCYARQDKVWGSRPRRPGLGVLHRPGTRRDAMTTLPRPLLAITAGPPPAEWLRLARLTRTLSWLSLAWMGIEGGVAIGAAIAAGSVALLGFGLDSGIEALASIIVIWRFTGTRLVSPTAERRAQKLVAASFFLLAPYIAAEAIRALAAGGPRRDQHRWARAHRRDRHLRARPGRGQAAHRRPARLSRHRRRRHPEPAVRLSGSWPYSPGWSPTPCSAPGGSTARSRSASPPGPSSMAAAPGHRSTTAACAACP